MDANILLACSLNLCQIEKFFVKEVVVKRVTFLLALMAQNETVLAMLAPLFAHGWVVVPVETIYLSNDQILLYKRLEWLELEHILFVAQSCSYVSCHFTSDIACAYLALHPTDKHGSLNLLLEKQKKREGIVSPIHIFGIILLLILLVFTRVPLRAKKGMVFHATHPWDQFGWF